MLTEATDNSDPLPEPIGVEIARMYAADHLLDMMVALEAATNGRELARFRRIWLANWFEFRIR